LQAGEDVGWMSTVEASELLLLPIYYYIGYPTGLKNEITPFGFQNRKLTGMPLGVKTRGNDAA
jgi:hypothetical protein